MLARLLLCILFVGIFAFEGFLMFLASIHGWPWLMLIGALFAITASTIIGFMLLGRTMRTTAGRAVAVGVAMAAAPLVLSLAGAF